MSAIDVAREGPARLDDAEASGPPVVACVDKGERGRAAARVACALAARLGAPLVLATVVAPGDRTGAGRRLLQDAAGPLPRPAELVVEVGEPAERLISLAQRESPELLVVSVPDMAPEPGSLLGNLYLAAAAAPCPVLLVPPKGNGPACSEGPIVCGFDGSEASLAAVGVAGQLASRLRTRLSLRRVPPPARADVDGAAISERLATIATAESAQLIVVGSRGAGAPWTKLMGGVASSLVRRAAQPVVIVPGGAPCTAIWAPVTRRMRSPD